MKKYLCAVPLVLLLCFVVGCQNKAAMAELEKFRAQAKLEEQNKALLSQVWELWNKGDFGMWKQLHADGYVYYSPSI